MFRGPLSNGCGTLAWLALDSQCCRPCWQKLQPSSGESKQYELNEEHAKTLRIAGAQLGTLGRLSPGSPGRPGLPPGSPSAATLGFCRATPRGTGRVADEVVNDGPLYLRWPTPRSRGDTRRRAARPPPGGPLSPRGITEAIARFHRHPCKIFQSVRIPVLVIIGNASQSCSFFSCW
jgi:hypothetical protein